MSPFPAFLPASPLYPRSLPSPLLLPAPQLSALRPAVLVYCCQPRPTPGHPVLQVLQRRLQAGSKPAYRQDPHKVALCIEGGGMRGALAAGMTAALAHLQLFDVFDVVYGTSAGAVVGAYFLSRQVPRFGARIYYDLLCDPSHTSGHFIDLRALRFHPWLSFLHKPSKKRDGAPRSVLRLERLIDDVMRREAPLDWDTFEKTYAVQPLIPIASSLTQMRAHAFRDVRDLDGLLERLRASACVPGISGCGVSVDGDVYVDGLFFEAIPIQSAVEDGVTHMVVLRTRSRETKVRKVGVYERLIALPALGWLRSMGRHEWRRSKAYLARGGHVAAYRRTLQWLQRADDNDGWVDESAVLSIVPSSYMRQLEGRPSVVFDAVRQGFADGFDALSQLRPERCGDECGDVVARKVFPDTEIARIQRRRRLRRKRRHSR